VTPLAGDERSHDVGDLAGVVVTVGSRVTKKSRSAVRRDVLESGELRAPSRGASR
jgi:hypothetical protein